MRLYITLFVRLNSNSVTTLQFLADCILCEIFQESQLGDTLCTFPFPSRVAPYLRQRLEIDRLNRRRSATCKTGRIKFPMPSPIHQPQNTIQYHTNAKNTDSICFFTFSQGADQKKKKRGEDGKKGKLEQHLKKWNTKWKARQKQIGIEAPKRRRSHSQRVCVFLFGIRMPLSFFLSFSRTSLSITNLTISSCFRSCFSSPRKKNKKTSNQAWPKLASLFTLLLELLYLLVLVFEKLNLFYAKNSNG